MKCPKCKGYGYYEKEEDGIIELIKCECQYTNEEWMRSANFEQLAGAIYEWYSLGFTRGKNGKKLNSVTEVVEWLKEIHDDNA